MNDIKELKVIIFIISGLGFIFFTINQYLNQYLLVEVLKATEKDTLMIEYNYLAMLVIGCYLLLLAFTELITKD